MWGFVYGVLRCFNFLASMDAKTHQYSDGLWKCF